MGEGKLTGTFEFDLFGGFAEIPSGVGFNLFRLRKASARFDFEKTSVVIGQDFTVFSPLVPRSFSGFAVHTLGGSGELIANRPFLMRMERRLGLGKKGRFLFAGELSDPNIGDLERFDPVRRAGSGERSGQPAYVIRLAVSRSLLGKEATFGLAGRYNRQSIIGVGFEQPIDGYALETDWVLPLSEKLTLRGEFFRGRSLAIFFGGVFQGVTFLPAGGARGITSTGGWAELNYDFASKWSFNGAFGVDDPRSRDLLPGMRGRNQSFFVNTIYKLTPAVSWMLEYHRIRTDYQSQPFNNTAVNILNSSWAFTF